MASGTSIRITRTRSRSGSRTSSAGRRRVRAAARCRSWATTARPCGDRSTRRRSRGSAIRRFWRLVPPGVRFEDLPPIHAVVISHDHYDHLDLPTVRRLAREHRPTFFVPLGLRTWFETLGIRRVVDLDWWQSAPFGTVTMTAVPAQHSSGRSLLLADQNERLWASWVVTGPDRRLFFAGDTGYHAGLAEIGRRLGPFDVAALPIGGYSDFRHHHPNHLSPEESVQAFEDLKARLLVPMHWGTFELNREPFREPPDRLMAEALRHGLEEHVAQLSPGQTIRW
jgi:N-acyl-phosphatidylethanolamine-hydrolysing phospholipase D